MTPGLAPVLTVGNGPIRSLHVVPGTPTGALAAIPAPTAAKAVSFAGTTSFDRSATLTGVADSSVALASFWLKIPTMPVPPPLFGSQYNIIKTQNDVTGNDLTMFIIDNGDGTFAVQTDVRTNGATRFYSAYGSIPNNTNWNAIMVSADVGHAAGAKKLQVYYGDTAAAITTISDTAPAMSMTFATGPNPLTQIFGDHIDSDADCYVGSAYQLWYGPAQYLDLSVTANRRKFIDGSGNVVNIGADGSTPTGTAPGVLLLKGAPQMGGNIGGGGALTFHGPALTAAASDPPGAY